MELPGHRLRKIRKERGLKQIQFARVLGISQTFLSDLEHNNSSMSEAVLNSIEYKTGINKEWIKTGKGGKVLYKAANVDYFGISESDLGIDLQSIVTALKKIPLKHRQDISKNVAAYIDSLCKLLKKTSTSQK